MLEVEKRIFIGRHLITQKNVDGVMMGRLIDAEIIPETSKYRRDISNLIKNFSLEGQGLVFYSSPTLRCRQTAGIFMEQLGLAQNLVVDERLQETDMGDFSGLKRSQIREKYPDLFKNWVNNPSTITFPNGESYEQVSARALDWFEEVLKLDSHVIFAFTHVDIIKAIVFKCIGLGLENKRFINIDPGGVCVLGKRKQEQVLLGLNLCGQ